jgi:starch phosphorylase
MKLMMNGALTLGTMDGANVEIVEACGEANAYIFGLNSSEVLEIWRSGYNSRKYYQQSEKLKNAIDRLYKPIYKYDFSQIADYLLSSDHGVADPFMCLADFDSYIYTYKKAIDEYQNRERWASMSLVNTAMSGKFSSDRAIKEYAAEIWHALPVYKSKR